MIAPATHNPFNVALVVMATFEVPTTGILPAGCPAPQALAGYWVKSANHERALIFAVLRFTTDQMDAFRVLERSFQAYRFDPMQIIKSFWPNILGPAVIELVRNPTLSLDDIDNQFGPAPEPLQSILPRNAV